MRGLRRSECNAADLAERTNLGRNGGGNRRRSACRDDRSEKIPEYGAPGAADCAADPCADRRQHPFDRYRQRNLQWHGKLLAALAPDLRHVSLCRGGTFHQSRNALFPVPALSSRGRRCCAFLFSASSTRRIHSATSARCAKHCLHCRRLLCEAGEPAGRNDQIRHGASGDGVGTGRAPARIEWNAASAPARRRCDGARCFVWNARSDGHLCGGTLPATRPAFCRRYAFNAAGSLGSCSLAAPFALRSRIVSRCAIR